MHEILKRQVTDVQEALLKLGHITKEFPGVMALNDVSLDVRSAEVHALVGENGAGKSTLIKILTGALDGWTGEIYFDGKPLEIKHPREAQKAGISTIYQELTLCPALSVAENVFLGREPKKKNGLIDWAKMNRDTQEVLDRLKLKVEPEVSVASLTVATQQLIEIARALTMKAKLIIMDEPTSSLSGNEVRILLDIIKNLRAEGVSVLYISHKFEEVFDISDRITIIRDGKNIATLDAKDADLDNVLSMMVGRTVNVRFKKRTSPIGDVVFSVNHLQAGNTLKDISFSLRKGEILGVSGLVGAGRTEMARAIFGIDRCDSGSMTINGRDVAFPHSPNEAMALGIGLLPEDRKTQGLILMMQVRANVTLPRLAADRKSFRIDNRKEEEIVNSYVKKLNIKTPSIRQVTQNLSGGNQQKVVIAKWLASSSKILIFDEPTRGIDVGAKAEIYDLMNELVEQGYSIIMISSELPEIMGMSDRIMVMHEGRIACIRDKKDCSEEEIMAFATGTKRDDEV